MPLLRRRPLLRAAAVGGGAYYAGKRVARSQEREAEEEARIESLEAQQYAAPPPVAAPAPAAPVAPAAATGSGLPQAALDQLKQLGQLHEQGVLTDEEFAAQKRRLLGT